MKKKGIFVGSIFIVIVGGLLLFFLFQHDQEVKKQKLLKEKKEQQELVKTIENAFAPLVVVTKESKLYEKDGKKYQEIGTIYKGVELMLEEEKITSNTKYFHLKDTSYYIPYQNVEKKTESAQNLRYQKYLPQEEVTLKKNAVLSLNGEEKLTISKELTTKVYRKQGDTLYVPYFNQLFTVKNEDVLTRNSLDLSSHTEKVPVLVYHFIYLNGEECGESICFHEDQVTSHFSYLQETGAFTLTTEELKEWIKGEIELPQKSVLITIDDGARAEKFIPFLEKYQLNATLFLITSWYDTEPFTSPYLELASHGHDLHNPGVCPGGQGGGIKCLSEEVLQNDFRLTREKLNGTTAFCFPFYEYNDYAIEQLKKGGFEMAFIGGMQKVTRNTDLFHIPRISLNSTTTQEEVREIVEG